ncbi:Mu transposase C-terminal domain-containing protein [Treponema phagedenis]|uniref:DDE-type integrase/transposase/recombinase n=1 Tax=Treponema phagedenis TaxID=162 RepID=A0AAE6IWH8_TREPH|nr:Mu transposase C-terminal domain-containing protein [Treponema phagedenis]QEJ99488.1 DDE-type integrase/transposase/recombinase [Treponema phagedenis]QEK05059.1 DDE-type integrase/transposase/recombinase [Treponema phagedenis]QEK10680.1 DDE-type integrase/transposase/recombinase [Treponema phagedenis]
MVKKWLSAVEIANIIGITKRGVNKRARTEQWQSRSIKANGGMCQVFQLEFLPDDVQQAYAASLKMDLHALKTALKPASEAEKKVNIVSYSGRGAVTKTVKPLDAYREADLTIAAMRVKLIESYSQSGLSVKAFIKAYEDGVIASDLKERLGRWGNIHTPSNFYKNWLAVYEQHGLAGIAPQYQRRKGGAGASFDEKAKEIIRALYLDLRKPSAASVVDDLKQYGYELNYSTVTRYIREIPNSVKVLYREGKKAYHDKFDPYIERDYTLFKPMEWGCADHHIFDFVIIHEGRIFRPWVTLFIDMRSRTITGWWIDVVPNTLTIMRAFSMSVDRYGLFENLLVDNGKDFRSEWFAGNEWKQRRTTPEQETLELVEGVLHDLNTQVHFATPYRGQSKPVERFFRTVCERFSKMQDFYVGSNTVDAPEDKKLFWGRINGRDKIEVTYTLEALRKDFGNFVTWFNSEWQHSGQGMDGKTPNEVFAENMDYKRELPEQYRKYIFTVREKRVVQRNGVSVDGISYYNPEMARLIGEKVEIRRDINDISKAAIFSLPDVVYQFDAESDLFKDKGITEESLRAVRKMQRQAREHLKDYRWDEDIRNARKTPAQLLAEKMEADAQDIDDVLATKKVVGGEPLVQRRKRTLRLPTDPD